MSSSQKAQQPSRLIGEGAFDVQLILAFLSLGVTFSILLSRELSGTSEDLIYLGLSTGVHLALFLTLMVVSRVTRSRLVRGQVGFLPLLLIGAAIGLERALLFGAGLVLLDIDPNVSTAVLDRLGQSLLFGSVVLPAIAILGTLRMRYSQQRKSLISERVVNEADSENWPKELRDFISGARLRLSQSSSTESRLQLAAEIRSIVEDELRPLSHKLWRRESSKIPSYRARDIVKVALSDHFYRPHFVVPIWFLSIASANITFLGFWAGVQTSAIRALVVLVVLLIARPIRTKTTRAAVVKFLLTFALIIGLYTFFGRIGVGLDPLPSNFLIFVGGALWTLQLLLITGTVWAFIDLGGKVRASLTALYAEAEIESPSWSQEVQLRDRELAQFLHGHLQNRLVTSALKLESETGEDDLQHELAVLEDVLNESLESFGTRPKDLNELIEKLISNWDGIINLTIDKLPESDQIPNKSLGRILEVLGEGVANAVRHGFAANVNLEVEIRHPDIVLCVQDDGTGPRAGIPGLGSLYLDSVSTDWSLTATGTGSMLRVVLAGELS